MPASAQKLSVTEKVGYSVGDTAANFIFQTMLVFQLSFYTDTFGITATAAGPDGTRVGLGEARGQIIPAQDPTQG